MRYWPGLLFLAAAAGFIVAGLRQRRAAADGAGNSNTHPSLAIIGEVMPGFIAAALAFTGLKTTAAWLVLDGGENFSLLDLAGFLVFLAAFGAWFWMKTAAWRDQTGKSSRPEALPERSSEAVPGE